MQITMKKGFTTKATFDSPCEMQNEERRRIQITVNNRVDNKGDI